MAYSNTVGKKAPIQKQNVGKRETGKKIGCCLIRGSLNASMQSWKLTGQVIFIISVCRLVSTFVQFP